ncbi:DUF1533 domain-containing protein [Paenibacillus hemerocallicola]|uniref:DUF1533 domain-containing protein n=1 Tax=Paenibacillus hemerocallicola TaxID=1172614 RepID=A0A5C4TGC4_9BACL|nr:cadherin-like beta sandwich domain-containing protein [Paenibacillus hemerocallicola]TNJ67842.1 DUF1533 domain-containing protein [Paenibacillus hemerocallicola]
MIIRLKAKRTVALGMIVLLLTSLLPMYPAAYGAELDPPGEEHLVSGYDKKWAVVPKWNDGAVIDGSLDESVWLQAAVLDDFRTVYANQPVESGPEYKLAYSDTHLFVGATLPGDEQVAIDKIELVISTQPSGDAHYVATIPINPLDRNTTTEWNPGLALSPAIQKRVQLEGVAYETEADAVSETFTVEASIPLSAFGPATITPGDEWRINVIHVYNYETKPLVSWAPLLTSRFNDSSRNISYTANVVDHGRLGSIFFTRPPLGDAWTPVDWKLDYTGFEEKQLSFEKTDPSWDRFQLEWKTPTGQWLALDEVTPTVDGSRVNLLFEHPGPLEDGLYQLRIVAYTTVPADGAVAILTFDREAIIAAGIAAAGAAPPPTGSVTEITYAEASPAVQAVLDLIPDRSGFRFVGLPEMPELNPDSLYTLSPDGQHLIAKSTGTIYPNALYPEDQVLTARNKKGEIQEYPYYEDEAGTRYFISAHLWYLQRLSAISKLTTIAKSDPLGAARILYRFAEAYEGYVPTTDTRSHNFPISITSGPPFNYTGGMWTRWSLSELSQVSNLIAAFVDVKKTNALELLSLEIGEDVENRLVDEMFIPSIEFVLAYPVVLSNQDYISWLGLTAAGKALNEPDYIHRTVEWMLKYINRQYLSDGFWNEVALSYHKEATNGLINALNGLKGWTDPPGYVSPRTGKRFDNLDLALEVPITEKAAQIANRLAYPNRKVLPTGDSWANDVASQPDLNTGSMLMPAAGIGKFTAGQGAGQTQLYMQFSPRYGHTHRDPLNLTLFAQGQELLPDLGYTYSKHRYFAITTMSHNTVVVNGKEVDTSLLQQGGTIERFVPLDTFQVMRASAPAYAETGEYSREPWFVPFPDGSGSEGYILDLFRVSGGDRHEYTLNGEANRDAAFLTNAPLTDYGPYLLPPGTEVRRAENAYEHGHAEGHYYGYIDINDVKRAELQDDRYQVKMVAYEDGQEQPQMNITGLLEAGNNELFLARSPSIRMTRLIGSEGDTNDLADLYDMPKLVLRREGTNLTSTFTTVLEPYSGHGGPRIDAVDRLTPDAPVEGASAVQIIYGNTTDIILSNPRHPQSLLQIGEIKMQGEMGFIRLVDGVVQQMSLVGGTLLQKGDRKVTGTEIVSGTITGTLRLANGDPYQALLTTNPVPASVIGNYVTVKHPDGTTRGYEIGDVRSAPGGQTAIVLAEHDPGFEINLNGSSEQKYYPHKQWSGVHTFEIAPIHIQDDEAAVAVALQIPKRDWFAGESVQLEVNGIGADGSPVGLAGANVVYSSSNPPVWAVNALGQATAVGEGTAAMRVEVTRDNVTLTDVRQMSVQAGQAAGLLAPPVLQSHDNVVYPGEPVRLTFADSALWRSGITAVTINGETVPNALYTLSAGQIQFVPGVFAEEGEYLVVVAAAGYRHASVEQPVTGTSALSSLTLSGGAISPAFSPWNTSYAATVTSDVYEVSVTAVTYDPTAVITVAGQVYANGAAIPLILTDGWNPLPIKVTAVDASSKIYTLTVRRHEPAPSATGTVTGSVYGPDLLPLPGATVRVSGYDSLSATTDEAGSFTLGQVPAGNRRLTVSKPGYMRSTSEAWPVTVGQSVYVSLGLHHMMPIAVTGVTPRLLAIGDELSAASTVDGTLHLVPAATAATREAIETASGASNGAWAAVSAEMPAAFATDGFAVGKYVLYAIDADGELSAASGSVTIIDASAVQIDETSPVTMFSGDWTSYTGSSYIGGTMKMSREAGSYADIPFYGQRAVMLGTVRDTYGLARIYLDGVYQTTIDYASPTLKHQQELYDTGLLTEGIHVLRVEATERKWIGFDALKVTIIVPPSLLTADLISSGEVVEVSSAVDGMLYLVPAATAATREAIETAGEAANGAAEAVSAGGAVSFDSTGFAPGTYKIYVINSQGRISAAEDVLTIVDPTATLLDDTSPSISYNGSWSAYTGSVYRQGTLKMSREVGAYADIPFYGQRAVLIGSTRDTYGQARIYLDGVYQTTINYTSPTIRNQQQLYDTGLLTEGIHVLRVEVVETKWINVDAVEVTIDE